MMMSQKPDISHKTETGNWYRLTVLCSGLAVLINLSKSLCRASWASCNANSRNDASAASLGDRLSPYTHRLESMAVSYTCTTKICYQSVSRDPVNFWSWSRIILRKSREENKSLFTSAALITEWPNFLVNLHNSIILQQFRHSITVFNSSRSFSHFFIPGKYCESRNLMCVTCFICTVQHLPILWPSQHFYKSDRKTVSSSCIETVLGDGYNADVHMLHPNLT